jgi:hypothetical protein
VAACGLLVSAGGVEARCACTACCIGVLSCLGLSSAVA